MTQAEHIERLSEWLSVWLLPRLSGNEAFVLRQHVAEARNAASIHSSMAQKVMQTEVFCSGCGSPLTIDGEKDEQTSIYKLYVCTCEVCNFRREIR